MSSDQTPASVAEALRSRADDDGVALVFEGRSWTWREVVEASVARAALLTRLRREGPFHVGVLLENVPEYVFQLGAAALTGATVVGINPTRRGAGLARDIRHTDCQLLVTDTTQAHLLEGLDLGVPPDRILLSDGEEFPALLEEVGPGAMPDTDPAPDTLFTLIFTSGSTGAPKAVRCTQGRLARTSSMGFSGQDVLYCSMPLFHGNALFSNWYPGVLAGATIVLRRRFSATGFLPDVREHGVTFFNTVGRALSYVVATSETDHDQDHDLRFGLAPEASKQDVEAFEQRFGCPVFGGYGSSEGAIRMVPPADAPPGALGTPMDGDDVVILDPETRAECPPARLLETGRLQNPDEAIGELVSRRGARKFEGYYNNDAADAERTRGGWFWSGDLAYRDAEGMFYFAGRRGDWLRVDGENFAAAPVERILLRHRDVAAAAVYAVPDPVTGDQVMAALELEEGRGFDPVEFERFLAEQADLGTKWTPRFVRVVEQLPMTATDKVHKHPLKAQGWDTTDPVWWKPTRSSRYVPFTDEDAATITATFEDHGRTALLPG